MRAFSLSDGVGVMDPITYLDELESVFDAERRAQVAGQGADLAEAEAATVKLEARLRARSWCERPRSPSLFHRLLAKLARRADGAVRGRCCAICDGAGRESVSVCLPAA